MFKRLAISLLGAALLASGATAAQAQTARKTTDFTVRNESSAMASSQGTKSLKFDTRKGRWGVSLSLDQRAERDIQWSNVQAGAYFRVTPSLRVGGAVAVGDDKQVAPIRKSDETPAKVKLETAFKF